MGCRFESAGIATSSAEQSTTWRVPHFGLEEPCCAALPDNNNAKALRGTTNISTQHERNTSFHASFASDLDTDTIGLLVLIVAGPLHRRRAVNLQEVPAEVNWNLILRRALLPARQGPLWRESSCCGVVE